MKVIITGGAGFIGSHLVDDCLSLGIKVIVLDNLSTGTKDNISKKSKLIVGDIRDKKLVMRITKDVDFIFHLAALTSVQESFDQEDKCYDVNINGMRNIITAASKNKVKKIIFSSSSAVYCEFPKKPKIESECPVPLSPYALSKLFGEHILKVASYQYGIKFVALRYFNVFGPRQTPYSDYAAVIPIFINQAILGRPLTIYGNGKQSRDFIYIKDVVGANLRAISSNAMGVFNIGLGSSMSINKLARLIKGFVNSKSIIKYAPSRVGDILYSTADFKKAKRQLKWSPRWPLEDGLKQTAAWFRRELRK